MLIKKLSLKSLYKSMSIYKRVYNKKNACIKQAIFLFFLKKHNWTHPILDRFYFR